MSLYLICSLARFEHSCGTILMARWPRIFGGVAFLGGIYNCICRWFGPPQR